MTEPSGAHFIQPGHNVAHLKGVILEKVRNPDYFVLKSKEHLLIRKFHSFRNGLNQEQYYFSFFLVVKGKVWSKMKVHRLVVSVKYRQSAIFLKEKTDFLP